MKIAQVAPLHESVPPKAYGGTERVVSFLTEELVRQGHEVTLYASGDSRTSARLVPCCPRSLRLDGSCREPLAPHVLMMERVAREAGEHDIVHFHTDLLHLPLARRLPVPSLTTLHGRLDLAELEPLFREFREHPLVSISDAQRAPLAWASWHATVHHGLPEELLRPRAAPEGYLAFVGRISPEKRVDLALEIAARAGLPLRIAAKVERDAREHFERRVAPEIARTGALFLGEVGEGEKERLLAGALGLVFPIDWPEPFGLVMIEALACGTPVVAFRRGSVPELIEDGVTGFVVDDLEGAVRAARRLPELSRERCRESFERRFGAARMARDYLAVYRSLTGAALTAEPLP